MLQFCTDSGKPCTYFVSNICITQYLARCLPITTEPKAKTKRTRRSNDNRADLILTSESDLLPRARNTVDLQSSELSDSGETSSVNPAQRTPAMSPLQIDPKVSLFEEIINWN